MAAEAESRRLLASLSLSKTLCACCWNRIPEWTSAQKATRTIKLLDENEQTFTQQARHFRL